MKSNNLSGVMAWLAGLVMVLSLGVAVCMGQVSSSGINGTVLDASGAVVPGAKVTLQNVDTGIIRNTVSNQDGRFAFLRLPPGAYAIKTSKTGFKTASQGHITLAVNQTLTYNFTLSVGSQTQTVTIQAAAAHIETSTAELGTAVNQRAVNNLPLNGRNFTQLLTLTPGASPISVAQNSGGFMANPIGSFTFPSINGQRNRSNFFTLDGINNFSPYTSVYSVAPPIDDIGEFKVQSHNNAEFGGVTGGIVNIVSRSGTNHFHGDVWEFLRNDAFDARNPFVKNVVPLKQNQFGGVFGGPVVLPHYNGRNKTFFFLSYEGFRRHHPSSSLFRTPTPQELNGNLSDVSAQIYNPFSTRPDPNNPGQFIRDPFTNNQIPANLIDPGMVAYAKQIFPTPVDTGVPGTNGINNFVNTTSQNLWSVRLDEAASTKDSFFFRYSSFDQPVTTAGSFPGLFLNQDMTGKNFGLSWTHMFGPTKLLQVEFGHNSDTIIQNTAFANTSTAAIIQAAGFGQAYACPFQHGPSPCQIPGISISGYLGGGPTYFASPISDIYEWRADYSMVEGNHTLMAGFDLNKSGFPGGAIDNYTNETFNSFETSNLESPSGTGNALASFLLGVPDAAQFRGTRTTEYGGGVYSAYVQDQWKATRKLTANIGLRWNVTLKPAYGSFADNNIYVGDFNMNTGNYLLQALPPPCSELGHAPCIPGTLPAHVAISGNHKILQNQYNNWAPRIGLAYALTPKTALRASFGMFWDNWAAITQQSQNYSGTWPSVEQALGNNLNPTYPTRTAADPLNLGTSALLPGPTPFNQVEWYVNPLKQNPYSEQWNFGVERQIGSRTVLSANYVGSHDSQLDVGPVTNVAVTPGPGDPTLRQPYPYQSPTYYDTSVGRSSYNAFQFSLKKNVGNLGYLVSYTWSKSMDIGCSGYFGVEGCSVQNPYNLDNNKSVSGFDLTHMLSASWDYRLPFGYNQKFSSSNHVLNYVAGGWQLNGILSLTSGVPYTVGVSGDIANTGMSGCCSGFYERLNLVGNPNAANQGPADWLNRAGFAVPAPFTFGTMGRNALRGDWYKNLDFSIFREFPITESKRFEFRADAFNLTNTPTWGLPDSNYSDPTFGEITSTRSTEREIQLALKLYF